jgi:hypothetical protein
MKTPNELSHELSQVIEHILEATETDQSDAITEKFLTAEAFIAYAIDALNEANELIEAEKAKAH